MALKNYRSHPKQSPVGHSWACTDEKCVCDSEETIKELLPIIKQWALEMIGEIEAEGGLEKSPEYYQGFEDAKDKILESIVK